MHSTTPAISNDELKQRLNDSIERLEAQIWCESLSERALMYGMAWGQLSAMHMANLIDGVEYDRRQKELSEALHNARSFSCISLTRHYVVLDDDDQFYVWQRDWDRGLPIAPMQASDGYTTVAEANAECVRQEAIYE